MATDIFIKLILSLSLGALIGIERERKGKGEHIEGMRTFMLVSFLATLSSYFAEFLNSIWIIFIAFSFVGILTAFGYLSKTRKKHFGLTTEIAFLLTFMIGLIVYSDNYPYLLSISSGIALTLILASKGRMHHFAKHLKEGEIWNAIAFAVITFVILPVLPNQLFLNFFNPFLVWLSIVLVLSISFVGYIAVKVFGVRRGIAVTGALGGLASSTAVTVAMSEDTKKFPKIFNSAAFAIALASSTMFLRMLAIDFVVNANVAINLIIPLVVLGVLGYFFSFSMWKKSKIQKINLNSPLSFKSAFSFGVFFIIVFLISRLAENFLGSAGILIFAFLAGLVEVDAINISLATLALSSLSPLTAVQGILLAGIANTVSKWGLSKFMGTADLAKDVGKVFIFIVVIGLALLYFVSI